MSRHLRALLNATPLPALGALGGLLLGCANRESDRADDAERARERAIGERDEARRVAAELRRDLRKAESDAADADGHALTLSTEVDRLRKIEADALADDDAATFEREAAHSVKAERDELARRCDEMSKRAISTRELLAAETARADAAEQWRAAHQAALDGLAGRESAEVAPDAEVCAWCLGPSAGRCFGGDYLCKEHSESSEPSYHDINLRKVARAASCPARRHSPDPLAIACDGDAGCGAMRGEPCSTDPFFPKATD
jgi:hypothetical protein